MSALKGKADISLMRATSHTKLGATSKWNHRALAFQRRRNLSANDFRGASQWVIIQMSIARRGGWLGVAEQAADNGQTKPATGA